MKNKIFYLMGIVVIIYVFNISIIKITMVTYVFRVSLQFFVYVYCLHYL